MPERRAKSGPRVHRLDREPRHHAELARERADAVAGAVEHEADDRDPALPVRDAHAPDHEIAVPVQQVVDRLHRAAVFDDDAHQGQSGFRFRHGRPPFGFLRGTIPPETARRNREIGSFS